MTTGFALREKKGLPQGPMPTRTFATGFPNERFLDHFVALQRNILVKSDFLECLRMEKRRVDRSKESLSIVLFSFNPKNAEGGKKKPQREIGGFLKDLNQITRETDIKGWVDQNVIGVLLPNTDKTGADFYVKKIFKGKAQIQYSVKTGTYPDHIFQELLAEQNGDPDLFPIDLDDQLKPFQLQRVGKRVIDVLGSLAGLILLSPLMLFIAVIVKAGSPGPIIFKQMRVGLKGVRFPFYKFRSMYWNVDDRVHREYVGNLIDDRLGKTNQGGQKSPFFKMKSDSRITRVGQIIRRLSLDELPQLYNVLKGDMSLVGPRPPLAYEVEKYQPWHLRRILEVKPGLTGLWQVNGRSTTTFNEMVRLDLQYVKNWSLWLDLKILLRTLKAVLHPHEAA